MRASAVILLVAIGSLLGLVERADAEKVKTNQTTKVYSRPGEQASVVLTVKSGQNMTLVEQEGRWLKVRVKGRTGYVPRSKVDMADEDDFVRNTRRRPFVDGRSRRRGFGGSAGPDDRVGADALGGGGGDEAEEEEEEEEEEDEKPAKPAKKTAAKSKPVDDEEEEEDEPKKPAKKAKPADDEEEEDEKPAKKAKPADEEEEDEEAGSDEEDPIDDEEVTDDAEDKRAKARVAKKVSVYDEPDVESDEKFIARPTDVLYPMETRGKWTAIENDEGDFGWVETEFLEIDDEGGGGGAPGKRQIAVSARLGLMFIQQGMRTAGSTNLKVPDNYNIATSSVTVSLGGGITMPFKKKYILGAEATYDFSKTVLGGIYYDPDPMDATKGVNTSVSIHNINVRAMGGMDFKKKSGMALLGRLGYRYQSFLVAGYASETTNPAKIPQEIVKAPTLGVGFMLPRLTEKLGLGITLDTILVGASVTQTKGLEDGSSPSVKAVVFGTAVKYRWKKAFDIQANYDLRFMKIDFGPPVMNMRGHMGTNVSRSDFFHMVTVGVAKPF